jgi:hypothetical protein
MPIAVAAATAALAFKNSRLEIDIEDLPEKIWLNTEEHETQRL